MSLEPDDDDDQPTGAVALTEAVDVCCPSVLAEPLAEAAEDLAQVFAALSDPVRLRLLSLVAQAGEICSCDLQDPLGKAQPTISHHTKVLAEAGLLRGEKRGRWVWWRIVPERLAAVRAAASRSRLTVCRAARRHALRSGSAPREPHLFGLSGVRSSMWTVRSPSGRFGLPTMA